MLPHISVVEEMRQPKSRLGGKYLPKCGKQARAMLPNRTSLGHKQTHNCWNAVAARAWQGPCVEVRFVQNQFSNIVKHNLAHIFTRLVCIINNFVFLLIECKHLLDSEFRRVNCCSCIFSQKKK